MLAISEAGLTLKASATEDVLKVCSVESITPNLAATIREQKAEILRVVREDEQMHRTGIIQSERQVVEMAREHFGSTVK